MLRQYALLLMQQPTITQQEYRTIGGQMDKEKLTDLRGVLARIGDHL